MKSNTTKTTVLKKFSLIFILFSLSQIQSQNLRLNIKGMDSLETAEISSIGYQKIHQNYISIKKELDSFSIILEKSGYLQNELKNISAINDSLYEAQFELNSKIELIRISDPQNIVSDRIVKLLDLNFNEGYFEIDVERLENFMKLVNNSISNQGKPFSSVQLIDLKKSGDSTLNATIISSETNYRSIDKIVIKGYEKFPRAYLRRNLKLKTGQPFNLNQIQRKTSQLKSLRFAKQIRAPEALFTKDSTILYIYVEKTRQNIFDGFLGFGSNETTNKLEFDGYLNLSLTNNLNYGESFELFYKSDENEQKTFNVNLDMPYILSSPLGASVNLNIFKRDSSFINVSQTAKLNYQFSSAVRTGIGISTSNSSNLLDTDVSGIEDYDSSFFISEFGYQQINSEDPIFPLKQRFILSAGIGKRTTDVTENDQLKLKFDGFKIFNLDAKNSVYAKITAEYLNSDTFLGNELPRFGGINSIRGFEENSLLANLYAVINTEYRYRASPNLYVHSVIDASYFENSLANQKSKLFGFGFGFGLLTNAGLLRLTYATGKREGQKIKINDSKVHLSLTAIF